MVMRKILLIATDDAAILEFLEEVRIPKMSRAFRLKCKLKDERVGRFYRRETSLEIPIHSFRITAEHRDISALDDAVSV